MKKQRHYTTVKPALSQRTDLVVGS